MSTVLLLIASNVFMTFALYGHLRYRAVPLWQAVMLSWLIALGEYWLQVPANRLGYGHFSAYQLKIIQEVVTLSVFAVFAYFYLGEPLNWRHVGAFVCVVGAVLFAFAGRS